MSFEVSSSSEQDQPLGIVDLTDDQFAILMELVAILLEIKNEQERPESFEDLYGPE